MDAEREGRLVIGDWIMGIGSKGGDGPATLRTSQNRAELRRAIALLRSVSVNLAELRRAPATGGAAAGLTG